MRIFIFHNIATDESGRHPAFHSGYVHGHPLVPVFEYWSWQVEPEDCANEAFRLFNVGHDPEFGSPDSRAVAYRQPGNRSLSKGDVVQVIDESGVSAAVTWLACASAGWEVVPPPAYIVRDASSNVTHALPLSVRVPALLDEGQVVSSEGHRFTPYTDGRVQGFRVVHGVTGRRSYVYLNPSEEGDEGECTVFLYMGEAGDPAQDAALSHVEVKAEDEFGHCDTCGANCDAAGCTADRAHVVAIPFRAVDDPPQR